MSNSQVVPKKSYQQKEALQDLIRGLEPGLDYFFKLHYAPLSYFAFRLLDDTFLAEETAAEAFVKLWNNRQHLTEEGSIKAWLYQTVRNLCIDHHRKVKRLRVSQGGLLSAETNEQSCLHQMIESETIRQIADTLSLLPPKCGQVFRMFYFEDKSYQEIAQELGISLHTARNQKERALRLLRVKNFLLACWPIVLSLLLLTNDPIHIVH